MTKEGQLFDRDGNRKYLNSNERMRFYRGALKIDDPGRRSFALTVFYTGCRISEALALTASSIDHDEKVLVLRTLKQRDKTRFRAIPIPDELLDDLGQQCEGFLPDERLWSFCRTTGWKVIKACMASSALSGIKATPKGLRHGFAVACVLGDVPLPTVQRFLGHSELQTTGIYLQFAGEDERALASRIWPGSDSGGKFES